MTERHTRVCCVCSACLRVLVAPLLCESSSACLGLCCSPWAEKQIELGLQRGQEESGGRGSGGAWAWLCP